VAAARDRQVGVVCYVAAVGCLVAKGAQQEKSTQHEEAAVSFWTLARGFAGMMRTTLKGDVSV
jgi:hypothetical protein